MDTQYLEILNNLRSYHSVFAEFWRISNIIEDKKIPTLEVGIVGSDIEMRVNRDFWNNLSTEEKTFALAHECLHIYFNHNKRYLAFYPKKEDRKKYQEVVRISADIIVNDYLINHFNFDPNELSFKDQIVTLESVNKDLGLNLLPNKSFEYYVYELSRLINQEGEKASKAMKDIAGIDSHGDPSESDDSKGSNDTMEDITEDLTSRLSADEIEEFSEKMGKNPEESNRQGVQAGSMHGNLSKIFANLKVKKKKKWEELLKSMTAKFFKEEEEVYQYQWRRRAPRFQNIHSDLLLPTELPEMVRSRTKYDVWAFQDTSGSCAHYAERFYKALRSIPEDRFNLRVFCFDTKVYPVDFKKGEVRGFGGTSFAPIEATIQRVIRDEKLDYPQLVLLVTDGYGNTVNPQYPERWHWLMTNNHITSYVHSSSKVHLLSKFE